MKLPDRIRRWWSPAKWDDDHPLNRGERAERNKAPRSPQDYYEGKRVNVERDFKKPR